MKFLFAIIFSFLSLYGFTQKSSIDKISQEQSKIENNLRPPVSIKGQETPPMKLVDKMTELKVPGVSIAVVKNGELYWAKSYGVANTETGKKVNNETLFQAGSISKPLAALAALQLVEQGLVDLDQEVNKYLKGWKVPESKFDENQKLTLRHLLTHTGGTTVHGFPGYTDKDDFPTDEDVLNGKGNTPAVFIDTEPGTNWRYSGGGYTIMEKMVEDVSGQPFDEYMSEHVLSKLGMTSSTYSQPLPASLKANASLAYSRKGKIIDGSYHHYPEQAAAGLWTTPTDLASYVTEIQKIYAGKEGGVISSDMAKQMLVSHKGNWGLGPALRGEDENLMFGHGGKNAGFTNNMLAQIHKGNAIIVMTSGDNGSEIIDLLQKNISATYDMGISELKEIEVIEISEDKLKRFVGTYQMEDNDKFKATVKVKKGKVVIKTRSNHILEPIGPLTFQDIKDPETLIFQEDENGNITGLKVAGPGIILNKIK